MGGSGFDYAIRNYSKREGLIKTEHLFASVIKNNK